MIKFDYRVCYFHLFEARHLNNTRLAFLTEFRNGIKHTRGNDKTHWLEDNKTWLRGMEGVGKNTSIDDTPAK